MEGTLFFVTANTSGVNPFFDAALTLAPISISASHDIGVPLGRRPHQCGLPAPWIARIDIGAAQNQLSNRIDAARAGGNHQRRFAVPASGGRLGAGGEEALHEHRIAVGCRQRQRDSPYSSTVLTLAPAVSSASAIERCPRCTAHARAVAPSG